MMERGGNFNQDVWSSGSVSEGNLVAARSKCIGALSLVER